MKLLKPIKVRYVAYNARCKPEITYPKGDWIDFRSDGRYEFTRPITLNMSNYLTISEKLIGLGVIMILPKGFELQLVVRSSVGSKLGLSLANSVGIIDQSYCGPNDIIKAPLWARHDCIIEEGQRIIQGKIVLSQFASFTDKLKWLFSSGISLEEVAFTDNPDRDGFGKGTKTIK